MDEMAHVMHIHCSRSRPSRALIGRHAVRAHSIARGYRLEIARLRHQRHQGRVLGNIW